MDRRHALSVIGATAASIALPPQAGDALQEAHRGWKSLESYRGWTIAYTTEFAGKVPAGSNMEAASGHVIAYRISEKGCADYLGHVGTCTPFEWPNPEPKSYAFIKNRQQFMEDFHGHSEGYADLKVYLRRIGMRRAIDAKEDGPSWGAATLKAAVKQRDEDYESARQIPGYAETEAKWRYHFHRYAAASCAALYEAEYGPDWMEIITRLREEAATLDRTEGL